MNAFEYAMKMETDGRSFYLSHAEQVEVPELRNILLQLAEDEHKHYRLFKAMHEGTKTQYQEAEQTTILRTVKNVFEQMKAQNKEFSFADEAKQIWEEAREVEKKSEAFYREQAEKMTDAEMKKVWHRIADEEQRHWITMENVLHFLDRPNHWLEDAEWSHLEEY